MGMCVYAYVHECVCAYVCVYVLSLLIAQSQISYSTWAPNMSIVQQHHSNT